jgi:hypothetical protein
VMNRGAMGREVRMAGDYDDNVHDQQR